MPISNSKPNRSSIPTEEPVLEATPNDPVTPLPKKNPNWDLIRSKLMGNKMEEANLAIEDLRKNIDAIKPTDYPAMVETLIPVFSSVLKTVQCTPINQHFIQKQQQRQQEMELESETESSQSSQPSATDQKQH